MAYYVFDDAKNLFEGMTKEEIIAAIAQATGVTPQSIDDGFITTLQEQNAQRGVKLWVGSQNEYNAIQQPDANTLYVVTDPAETNELQNQIDQLQSEMNTIVAAATTNASGYVVETLESNPMPLVYNSTYQWYEAANLFVVPEGAAILEYCWKRTSSDNHTNDIYASRESDTEVKVVYHSDAQETGTFILSLVISYPQAISLPELTDIRVGYDGTVYGSAGEAVRKQAFSTRFHDYIKQALLNLLAHVAYTDANGQQYYNALQAAMYMTAGVTSITAVFNQGQNVIYDTDDLDTLRQYLTVTAHFEDNTSATITDYTLSGTLEAGTSTITVSYAGKTTTFNVTVTHSDVPRGYTAYDYIRYTGTDYAGNGDPKKAIKTAEYANLNNLIIDFDFMAYSAMTGSTAGVLGGQKHGTSGNGSNIAFYARTDTQRVSVFSHGTAIGINDNPNVQQGKVAHINLNPHAESPSTLTVDSLTESGAWTDSQTINTNLGYCGKFLSNTTNNECTLKNFAAIGILRLYDLSNNLVGEYIPCVRNSDNVVGIYDTVTETFLTTDTETYATTGNANCVWAVGNWGT